MSVTPLRPRPPARAYTDPLGSCWGIDTLDALLADDDVKLTVMAGVCIGLQPDSTWSPGRVWAWAKSRYQREEAAGLLQMLVTRFFDTDGAHYLGREPCR